MHALWALGSLVVVTGGICCMELTGSEKDPTVLQGLVFAHGVLSTGAGIFSFLASIFHEE